MISEKAKLERLEHDAVEGRKDGLTPGSWQASVGVIAADVGKNGEAIGLTKSVAK